MSDQTPNIDAALGDLLAASDDQLYEQLAVRSKTISAAPAQAGEYALQAFPATPEMGPKEDLIESGKRLYKRLVIGAYGVVCGNDEDDVKLRNDLIDAFGVGQQAVAGVLVTALVAHMALAPAVATVVAALIVKLFFRPAYDEFCRLWKKNLPKVEEGG